MKSSKAAFPCPVTALLSGTFTIIFVTNLSLLQLIDNSDCLVAKMPTEHIRINLFDTKPADTSGRNLEKAAFVKILRWRTSFRESQSPHQWY